MQSSGFIKNESKHVFLIELCNSIKEGAAIIEKSTGKLYFCNRAWLNLFEISTGANMDLLQLRTRRKVPLTDEELHRRWTIAEETGVFSEQAEFISCKGTPFWGELTVRPFKNNDQVFYLTVIDRIDEVKDSENKIAQDKQRFEALLEHASMGIIETNNLAEIININQFALNLFGYSREELLNRKIELLIPARFHGKHVGHRDTYMHHPRSRPMGVGMDLFAVKKDGTEFPVEVSLSNYMRNGEQCVIAFVSDITIRKRSEMEIKKLNDELEETVEQRTQELRNAIQALEVSKEELSTLLEREKELSELKSRFVSMASHEFRTPLSTVLSSAYLLEQYNTGEEQPRRERHLKRIISSVNMLTDILNDFLSVGRIEEGKIHVRFTEFNIKQLIDSTIEEVRHNLKKEQTIEYEHEGNTDVLLDASLLKHIIMNLVSNASKFSPEGSAIEIKSKAGNDHAVLSVKDHGIGISKEDQKHLMERFFRATNAINIQGTGLGLHIVSKYVELMNGVIECNSELEQGTEFIISFNANNNDHEKDLAY